MARVTIPAHRQAEHHAISPDWVRISMAAAIELGLKPGRLFRGARCGCVNLLQNYPEGCYANCAYCGLARERPGVPEENTFIRVSWPLYPTDLVARRIAAREAERGVGRVCIAQVQDHRAVRDLIDMTGRVRRAAPRVPISALVSATALDEEDLPAIREAGADIIGVGLDAASRAVFDRTRGRAARGPHDWEHHWRIVGAARRLFGPWKVNCHLIVGLGETDRELVELFFRLREERVAAYLFSFNPEPGTAMQDIPRAPIERLRRIQLTKHLIERWALERDGIRFDAGDRIARLVVTGVDLDRVVESGVPFMTDGCPDRRGELACNRPFGSYRPGEAFRDYPFRPARADIAAIREEMKLGEVLADGKG